MFPFPEIKVMVFLYLHPGFGTLLLCPFIDNCDSFIVKKRLPTYSFGKYLEF